MTNGPLLAQKFEDRKSVYMLTTAHKAGTVTKSKRGGQTRTVPECVDSYNKHMGGVDRIDQMLEPYDTTRKTEVVCKARSTLDSNCSTEWVHSVPQKRREERLPKILPQRYCRPCFSRCSHPKHELAE
ncbi:hypothetical protein RRG08_042830 [Elysia crispata]|uniref:PiggyBac transposable element-derived protein domain-containing protein n=1 Tax=Elysia crispata TaxID=231223 RepID=A0AAE1AC16_9GAST|nr:hypothetical protein RRG08_042830 [Elysia crispata]